MTLDEIEEDLTGRGIQVVTGVPPAGMWACYSKQQAVVVVHPALTERQRRAALMHELIHAERGDEGHQSPKVERLINMHAARRLIRSTDYVRAEKLHGGNTAGVAAELDVPVWLVEAYRDDLMRRSYK